MGLGWGGVGDGNVPCTCTHGRCYASHGMGWGGVGWGGVLGMVTFLALAHMVGWGCYATSCSLQLAHMVGATQVMGLGWGGVGMITFLNLHTWSVLRKSWSF